MKTFVLMTKLAPASANQFKDRKKIGREWLDEVKNLCPEVKFISHYALLGNYDFMDIYEAPDENTAAKVSMISRLHGAQTAESWTALPYQEFLKISESL